MSVSRGSDLEAHSSSESPFTILEIITGKSHQSDDLLTVTNLYSGTLLTPLMPILEDRVRIVDYTVGRLILKVGIRGSQNSRIIHSGGVTGNLLLETVTIWEDLTAFGPRFLPFSTSMSRNRPESPATLNFIQIVTVSRG